MQTLIVLALVGFVAQLIDGALGMAYGVSSTTLLLVAGVNPATASASVHFAEVATTLASGASHWRLGNVDWRVVRLIALPGFVGAFLGAVALSSVSANIARPWMAVILFTLGVVVLTRFAFSRTPRQREGKPLPAPALRGLGGFAGFMDAAGGGGWGPIGTPALLATGRLAPRKVVGSVDTAEFLVAIGASIGFLLALGSTGMHWRWVGALIAGGLVAAPIAALLVRKMNARVLGTAVGGLILVTNAKTLGEYAELGGSAIAATYALIVLVWCGALAMAIRALRTEAPV